MDQFRLVMTALAGMYTTSRILENKGFIQHGSTTVYSHCRNVAFVSLKIARMLRMRIDSKSLVRGALLHDYFLYDWHDRKSRHSWHGFTHPTVALKNAMATFNLNTTEQDIIKHHMFPLTPCPPKTKEGWLVSLADKICGLYETFRMNETHIRRRHLRLARQVTR